MPTKNVNYNVSISMGTFLKLLLIFLVIVFLYLIKEVIVLIFVALILASAFDPWVDWFQKKRIPRGLSIIFIYLILISIIGTAIWLLVPPISQEVGQLSSNLPNYYERIESSIDYFKGVAIEQGSETSFQDSLDTLSATLTGATTKVFNTIFSIFGGVISFFLVLVITFYFTVEEEGLKNFLKSVSPSRMHPYLFRLITRIQHKLGLWLKGQLILSLIIFGLVFIGLSIIGVEYALLLAFVAGVFEIIPFLGPTLAAIPAAFFGFTQSPVLGLLVIALYVLIQQLENHVIVPKVMSKSVGLNPLIVIVAFLVGAKIGGFIGVLLAVPVATAISVFLSDFFEKRIEKEVKLAK
ncbi:AI-2E family transporter [bacterium]|jgi:predicted PurR-regulated permease PerM|nr:AI-2E family transporter [bacterium]MBT4121473.1 AI-2E family transporter [bacterium]MBT4335281.1 AI-2E family transporter [bacterium]MBT4495143.1 AI-2E family transporter [bacterium]MBT4764383.1 AI-2E family transporter [bacterium]